MGPKPEVRADRPLLMLLLCVGVGFMGCDIVLPSLQTLRHLGIRYPAILDYTPILAPAIGFGIYLSLRRRSPFLAGGAGFVLASLLPSAVANWVDHRPAQIPIVSFDSLDIKSFEDRLGCRVIVSGAAHGAEIRVSPEHAVAVTAEAKRLGIFDDGNNPGVIRLRPRSTAPTTVR